MLSSRDGYCTLVTFDEILPTHHTQQAALQLQQIAAQHSVPISYAPSSSHSQSHSQTPSSSQSGSGRKRPHEPLTPAAHVNASRPDHEAAPPPVETISAPTAQSRNRGPTKAVDATADQADAMVAQTRAKLADIDKLLGDMPE